jgi:uncharacterized protein YbjT (DUF2867 family)
MEKMILVLGATGTLGKPVASALKAAGFRVRIMTRDLKKAQKNFDNTYEKVAGDPMDPDCLEEALEGCYGVHISLPTEVEQQVAESVARLAPRHAIARITYISGATVSEEHRWFPMIDRKFRAEKAIRESGIPYTFFGPTWVMDSLPIFIVGGRASVLGTQPYPYHWVAADDIARMVASAYRLEAAANKRFILHGPEGIRLPEALQRYCAAFQPDIQKVSSMPFWLVKLLATVMRNPELKGAGEMMAYFEKVGEETSAPKIDGIIDAPKITLDQWLQRRKASL